MSDDVLERARNAVAELANIRMEISLEHWGRLSSDILAALTASRSSNDEIVEVLAQIVQCDDDADTEYYVLADCTDNDGKAYQSHALSEHLARARALLSKVKEQG